MNLEELRSVRRAERQKDSLQHLRDSFYRDVADYIVQLKDERERAVEAADDPFSSEDVRKLTDRIESTTEIANALYERRVGKVVKHASFAAADMATDEDGMTTEERDLFDDLVARIRANRETVLATLDGNRSGTDEAETATDAPDSPAEAHVETEATPGGSETETPAAELSDTTESNPAPSPPPETMGDEADDLLADALGEATDTPGAQSPPPEESATGSPRGDGGVATTSTGADPSEGAESPASTAEANDDATHEADVAAATTEPSTASQSSESTSDAVDGTAADTERVTLRITRDVPAFYGIDDRDYDLAPEDVVTLPTTNAEPLIQKNAAERID